MEIVFWVMLTLVGIFLFVISYFMDYDNSPTHNDSRPGSYYQESQKKQWQKREMDK